jgi:hypothetical protein
VRDQLTHRGLAPGLAQPRRVAVEALEHPQLGELRTVCPAVVATILVIEAIRNSVSGVTGSGAPTARGPAAPS